MTSFDIFGYAMAFFMAAYGLCVLACTIALIIFAWRDK